MNNYQIYEEVGKGKFTTVYKGRRKKSIEYFAIVSIDKSQRHKVLNNAHCLRSLNHRNVLRFCNWYETNNHLWLILEYCTGGDLKTLLKDDGALPEDSTRVFGADLLHGLMYIHSRGIIYTDFKPSNILIDGLGFAKFCDFGLSQTVDSAAKSTQKVGTPSYMAPELFRETSVASFASDLWSLGCILYEMATGQPPFSDRTIQGLMTKITTEPVPKVDHYSPSFTDLLEGLLNKDPLERFTMADVCASDFWKEEFKLPAFPPQPGYDAFRKRLLADKARAAQSEGDRTRDLLRASINAERNLQREIKLIGGYQQANNEGLDLEKRVVDFGESREDDAENDVTEEEAGSPLAMAERELSPNAGHHPPPHAIANNKQSNSVNELPTPTMKVDLHRAAGTTLMPQRVITNPAPQPLPTGTVQPMESLLFHSSDANVKPIVMNSRIERLSEPKYSAKDLPFAPQPASHLKSIANTPELETYMAMIYKALGGTDTVGSKHNVLCYFETLCTEGTLANIIVNSNIVSLFTKMLAMKNMPQNVKVRVSTVMGLLVRHAVYINPDRQKFKVIQSLTMQMADKTPKVRRRSISCLGELVFYVATQPSQEMEQWEVPADAVAAFQQALADEDEIVRHYAVKTVENTVIFHDKTMGKRFASAETLQALVTVFQSSTKNEHMRASSLVAMVAIAMIDTEHVPLVTSLLPASSYLDIFKANNSRCVQALVTFMNFVVAHHIGLRLRDQQDAKSVIWSMVWSSAPDKGIYVNPTLVSSTTKQYCLDILHTPGFFDALQGALERSNSVIRGKLIVFITQWFALSRDLFVRDCSQGLCVLVDKVARDKDAALSPCLLQLCDAVRLHITQLVTTPTSEIMSCIVATMSSYTLRSLVVTDQFIQSVGQALGTTDAGLVLPVLECLVTEPSTIKKCHAAVTRSILFPLTHLLGSGDSDQRFTVLKIQHDFLAWMINDPAIYNLEAPTATTQAIHDLTGHLFARMEVLLEEDDPIPLYTLKLLSLLCNNNSVVTVSLTQRTSLVTRLVTQMDAGHRNNNVNNTRVVLAVLEGGGEAGILNLLRLGVAAKVFGILEASAAEDATDQSLETCLEIMATVLQCTLKAMSSNPSMAQSMLLLMSEWTNVSACAALMNFLADKYEGSVVEDAAWCISILCQLSNDSQRHIMEAMSVIRSTIARALERQQYAVTEKLLTGLVACVEQLPMDQVDQISKDELLLVQVHHCSEESEQAGVDTVNLANRFLNSLYTRTN